jgi:hypothetical protein
MIGCFMTCTLLNRTWKYTYKITKSQFTSKYNQTNQNTTNSQQITTKTQQNIVKTNLAGWSLLLLLL